MKHAGHFIHFLQVSLLITLPSTEPDSLSHIRCFRLYITHLHLPLLKTFSVFSIWPTLPSLVYSAINPSNLFIATFLRLTHPEYTDPIPEGLFTLEPDPIIIVELQAYLNTAPPYTLISCFTPGNPIAIEFLWKRYPPSSF